MTRSDPHSVIDELLSLAEIFERKGKKERSEHLRALTRKLQEKLDQAPVGTDDAPDKGNSGEPDKDK